MTERPVIKPLLGNMPSKKEPISPIGWFERSDKIDAELVVLQSQAHRPDPDDGGFNEVALQCRSLDIFQYRSG